MLVLGTLAIVGSFAKHKRAIDRYAPTAKRRGHLEVRIGKVEDTVVREEQRANASIAEARQGERARRLESPTRSQQGIQIGARSRPGDVVTRSTSVPARSITMISS